MRRKAEVGICSICGKKCALTFEHVPPKAAFNTQTVDEIPQEEALKLMTEQERLPWDTSGLKKIKKQGGVGANVLCQSCNNNTGSWYMNYYAKFAHTIAKLLSENDNMSLKNLPFEIYDFQPLPIFKAVMTMFCDINNKCFGDNNLKKFILNKDENRFDKNRYKVYAYIWNGVFARRVGLCGQISSRGEILLLSEVANFPLGFVLHINPPPNSKPNAFEITHMVDFNYNESTNMMFDLPINSCNTIWPQDFRDKEAILANQSPPTPRPVDPTSTSTDV